VPLQDYYNTGDDQGYGLYGATWQAQTFTASSSYTITSVKLLLYRYGNPGTITVSIRATTSGAPSGADLCSGTTDGNTLPTGSPYEWREITFGAGTPLTSGTKYAIVARAAGTTSDNSGKWRVDTTDPTYTNGSDWYSTNSGGNWTEISTADHLFETYSSGQTYTQTVTESMGLSDSIVKQTIFAKTAAETMGLSDTIAKQTTFGKTFSESMGLSDSITPSKVKVAEVTETMGLADSIGKVKIGIKNVSETLSASDTIGKVKIGVKSVSESMGLSDSISTARAMTKEVTETMGLTDRETVKLNQDTVVRDNPDYTLPVTILAIEIESLPVNIVAQTIGTLSIDIKAQSIGNIDVNLAASAITLNVNISSQTANINVNLAASAVTLNVNISSQTGNLNVNIAAQAANVTVSLVAQTVDITVLAPSGKRVIVGTGVPIKVASGAIGSLNPGVETTLATLTGRGRLLVIGGESEMTLGSTSVDDCRIRVYIDGEGTASTNLRIDEIDGLMGLYMTHRTRANNTEYIATQVSPKGGWTRLKTAAGSTNAWEVAWFLNLDLEFSTSAVIKYVSGSEIGSTSQLYWVATYGYYP